MLDVGDLKSVCTYEFLRKQKTVVPANLGVRSSKFNKRCLLTNRPLR